MQAPKGAFRPTHQLDLTKLDDVMHCWIGPCVGRLNSELITYKKYEAQVKRYCLLNNKANKV